MRAQIPFGFTDGKLDTTIIDCSIPKLPFSKDTIGSLIDVTLGMMFVDALKKTGTRDAVLQWMFPKEG